MPASHQVVHLAIEKAEQQGANMRTVDICIGHDDHFVVPALTDILLRADADAHGRNHALNFFICEHFVFARFVRVDDLAPQWQNRLKVTQPPAFRTTTG